MESSRLRKIGESVMQLRRLGFSLVAVAILGAAAGVATEDRLRIEVAPPISPAPAVVRVRAIVAPDASNRSLQIVVESGDYYRSSLFPLDGANAPLITEAMFKNLPGGEYVVDVVLVDANGGQLSDSRQILVTATR